MEILSRFGYVPSLNSENFSTFEHCIYGNKKKSSLKRIGKRNSEPIESIHNDISGPMPTILLGGASYSL